MYSGPLLSPHEQSAGALPHLHRFNKVYVVFRENKAYEGAIQTAIEDLRETGREVELKKFPRGTSPDVIREEMSKIMPELSGKYVFADRTVLANSEVGKIHRDYLGTLDDVFSEASSNLLAEVLEIEGFQGAYEKFRDAWNRFGKESKPYKAALQGYYKAFTRTLVKLFELALAENYPDQIIIIAAELKKHLPFAYSLGVTSPQQRIKEAIIRTGYPKENITICKTPVDFEKLRGVDFERTWIVANRHIKVEEHIAELKRQEHLEQVNDGARYLDDDDCDAYDDETESPPQEYSTRDLWERGHGIFDGGHSDESLTDEDMDDPEDDEFEDQASVGLGRDSSTYVDLPVDTTVIALPIESLVLSLDSLGLIRVADNAKWPARVSGSIQRNLAAAELSFNRKRNGKAD